MLMVFLVANTEKTNEVLDKHFEQVADKFLQQAISGVTVLLIENKTSISRKMRNSQLQSYLNNLATADYIKQVHLYDETGLLLQQSEAGGEASASIKLLYGIDENMLTLDKSEQYVPFIKEIRSSELVGYLRVTIEKSYLTSEIAKNNSDSHTLSRLLLIIAGLIGFLLTRGLNRFSRQGYRAPKSQSH
jgi:membrane protein